MEFGGTAPRMQIVERVYEKMKDKLNDYDLSPMPYNKYIPRWKDTLHWVRIGLVERGILAKGTEKGIWSLTDYGKAYYAQQKDGGNQENNQTTSAGVEFKEQIIEDLNPQDSVQEEKIQDVNMPTEQPQSMEVESSNVASNLVEESGQEVNSINTGEN